MHSKGVQQKRTRGRRGSVLGHKQPFHRESKHHKIQAKERNLMRKSLDRLADQLKIELQSDWFKTSESHLPPELLRRQGSLVQSLRTAYPEFIWHKKFFTNDSKISTNETNPRQTLDWIAEQLKLYSQSQWYHVSRSTIRQLGGMDVMRKFRGSVSNALMNCYPEYEWHPILRRSNKYLYMDIDKQKELLNIVKEQLGIESERDWSRVSLEDVKSIGAFHLFQHYGDSIQRTLETVYPEYDWSSVFHKKHQEVTKSTVWSNKFDKGVIESHRRRMDWLGNRLGIERYDDWYWVTIRDVKRLGGTSLMDQYGASLYRALQSVYPEFQCNPFMFKFRPLNLKNKREMFDWMADWFDIQKQDDWYEVIDEEMDTVGGPVKAARALKDAYPEFSWKSLKRKGAPQLLLARTWNESIDPTGYWISEKFDGSRALWNGREFVSRMGQVWNAPSYFTAQLPKDMSLDGELWGGVDTYDKVCALVRTKGDAPGWRDVVFKVFDAPSLKDKVFEDRIAIIRDHLNANPSPYVQLVELEKCTGIQHLKDKLKEVEERGGEGIMLRAPNSLYEGKRSNTLLKVKSFLDADARVIAHQSIHQEHTGKRGIVCETETGNTFIISRGLTEEVRANPPPIGSIVSFSYVQSSGVIPKFPVYIGIKHDADFQPVQSSISPEERARRIERGLQDIINRDLNILFVATNPTFKWCEEGHYFSERGHSFWLLLHASGLLPHRFTPQEDADLLQHGIGITTLCSRAANSSSELTRDEMHTGWTLLQNKLKSYHPKICCFIGKAGFESIFSTKASFGLQKTKLLLDNQSITCFVTPSMSASSQVPASIKLRHFRKLKRLLQ